MLLNSIIFGTVVTAMLFILFVLTVGIIEGIIKLNKKIENLLFKKFKIYEKVNNILTYIYIIEAFIFLNFLFSIITFLYLLDK